MKHNKLLCYMFLLAFLAYVEKCTMMTPIGGFHLTHRHASEKINP